MSSSRAELMQRALALEADQRAFAKLFGVSESRVSKLMRGARLSIPNCIRLSALLHEDPIAVLRVYGYTEEADAFAETFAQVGKLPKTQMNMATRYGKLPPRWQRWVRDALTAAESAAAKGEP